MLFFIYVSKFVGHRGEGRIKVVENSKKLSDVFYDRPQIA